MSNILKRKNEEDALTPDDQLNKRVALDSEQLIAAEALTEKRSTAPEIPGTENSHNTGNGNSMSDDRNEQSSSREIKQEEGKNDGHAPNTAESGSTASPLAGVSKPVREDADHVALRMLCPVKEAGIIVGKKGEKITHIREKANVRIYVLENLKNVLERVVSVKGLAENVARAFGLLTRTILDEPEDEPASMHSKQYVLKLLVPHAVTGYVIGKSGSKFREIEENSAAKLKAAEQPLPFSTDRVLTVAGVGDAIHIAVYYISQVLLEHRDALKKSKVVFYNPANFRPQAPPAHGVQPGFGGAPSHPLGFPSLHPGFHPAHNGAPMQYMQPGLGMASMGDLGHSQAPPPFQQKPYDFGIMFQPAVRPQYAGPLNIPITQAPPQSLYTDEHGNTITGDVITNTPAQPTGEPDRFTQDVFVANTSIGSVIGKGGNNIKHIRESSGCAYVKIEPDQHQLILLGNGRGLTNIRKLTLTGSYNSIQTAIFLINQRVSGDKERNGVQ